MQGNADEHGLKISENPRLKISDNQRSIKTECDDKEMEHGCFDKLGSTSSPHRSTSYADINNADLHE